MAKTKTVFVCQNCGWKHPRWVGQCQECQEWNSLVEETLSPEVKSQRAPADVAKSIIPLSRVEAFSASKSRISTTIGELDRVLGGEKANSGMVPGAVMLIGGEPGIGKSTLLTQVVVGLLQQDSNASQPIVYVAGEESPSQIALRVQRILSAAQTRASDATASQTAKDTQVALEKLSWREQLQFVTSTEVEVTVAAIRELKPRLVIVDSIQTMTSSTLTGAAGSVGQIRESAEQLTTAAKAGGVPLFLVGHVTKEGELAGPKVLEHIVDSVLELSGERRGDLRLLRAVKNRFGATDEVGVFRVTDAGYDSVSNPSEFFLEHTEVVVPGSTTICVMEGTRPLLIEVQSLVVQSQLAMPRRVGRGIELSRLQVLSAVLQKHCRVSVGSSDIFASVAGGFTVREPAVDLGLAVAIASSLKNKAVPKNTVFIGEVGLLGEVRGVSYLERRIKEARRLGFEHIISRENYKTVKQVLQNLSLL